jgi:hypothetical protein
LSDVASHGDVVFHGQKRREHSRCADALGVGVAQHRIDDLHAMPRLERCVSEREAARSRRVFDGDRQQRTECSYRALCGFCEWRMERTWTFGAGHLKLLPARVTRRHGKVLVVLTHSLYIRKRGHQTPFH